jgi:membrane-associated protease RseP (regulator of RpoE activity)
MLNVTILLFIRLSTLGAVQELHVANLPHTPTGSLVNLVVFLAFLNIFLALLNTFKALFPIVEATKLSTEVRIRNEATVF